MHFDVLIKGGLVVDGCGKTKAYQADVALKGDRIAAIGKLDGAAAERVIDARGRAVSPGFIDVHIHSEIALLGGEHQYGAVLQGVTTHLTAPDGFGWAPLNARQARELYGVTYPIYGPVEWEWGWPSAQAFLNQFKGKVPANLVPQVPHCAVRYAVMGWSDRPARADELKQMERLTREWLEAGATCLCLGLDYQPSMFATFEELAYLCRVTKEYDGIYAAHVRNTLIGPRAAWIETFELGRRTGIPLHFSHSQVTPLTRPLMEAATDVDWTFESYLYPAGCTHLVNSLPAWAQVGGVEDVRRRLSEPGARARVVPEWQRRIEAMGGPMIIVVTPSGRHIRERVRDADQAFDILMSEDLDVLTIRFWAGEEAEWDAICDETVVHPKMMVASDGIYRSPHGHPRGYGCFARVLRRFVRERKRISLEEAVWKMAGFPAQRYRIKHRGLLREGYGADVVVFDPDTVADGATWDEPFRHPLGIDVVIVNGQVVVEEGRPTGRLPGKVLQ